MGNPSFQKLHREIVWECADSFVVKLLEDFKSSKESRVDMRLLVAHKIPEFEEMGTALYSKRLDMRGKAKKQ